MAPTMPRQFSHTGKFPLERECSRAIQYGTTEGGLGTPLARLVMEIAMVRLTHLLLGQQDLWRD